MLFMNFSRLRCISAATAILTATLLPAMTTADSTNADSDTLPPLQRMAGRLERFGRAIPQEKVFVHTDNTSYHLGDTIWFAAYTRNTATDRPSNISRVLYAELWNHDGYLVERKLVEMKDGRGHNFFELPDTLYAGYFELRAYTRWQLNWGQTEHYHNPLSEYWFYNRAMAKDFFRDYDKLYSRVFPVYDKLAADTADGSAAAGAPYYREMTTRPLRRYFKTAPKEPELRLSIFPEGGHVVAGVPCHVAFEAATSEGEVREGTLTLTDEDRRVVATTHTVNRGRAAFTFTPRQRATYHATFTPDSTATSHAARTTKDQTASLRISDIEADGVALHVHRDAEGAWNISVAAAGKGAQQPLGLTVMHEGKLEHFEELAPGSLADRSMTVRPFATGTPPAGIHQVTVFDTLGHVWADRLFFAWSLGQATPRIAVSGVRESYEPYEPIDLDIALPTTTAEGQPASQQQLTPISIAVRDVLRSDRTFDSGNILTEMLLASEIKGFVPQPEYFFEADDADHQQALDLLMLTQGWRRFGWHDMAVQGAWELTHPAEHAQIISGTVNDYYADISDFDITNGAVAADHDRFMRGDDIIEGMSEAFTGTNDIGNRSYGWNLLPSQRANDNDQFFASSSTALPPLTQRQQWSGNDYNALSFRSNDTYRHRSRLMADRGVERYVEEGSIGHEVRVHADFVDLTDSKNLISGDSETERGRFLIDLPRLDGQCVFFLAASDTTKWKKSERHAWVEVDPTDEYSTTPAMPEFYVRVNWAYPRWVKPYTFYQVHSAPQPFSVSRTATATRPSADASGRKGSLLTEVTQLDELTVRATHGGLRRVDYTKPAYVIDALEAYNMVMDAGLSSFTTSNYEIAQNLTRLLVSDMGMERRYDIRLSEDSSPGLNRGPLDQKRYKLLTFADKFYVYTDYSPRREGDERYEQDNQPSVQVDIRRMPDWQQRVTYINRRYILSGFAFQEDFYNPDYQRTPPTEATRDWRRTLYWNPELKPDADGHVRIRLYNSSRQAAITVDAEGQAADGTLLYNNR